MSSSRLATRIRGNLASTDSRSKLVASLIASVLASADVPLCSAIDDALTLHGYDLVEDRDLGLEVALRLDALNHSLGPDALALLLNRARDDDRFSMHIAHILAVESPVETETGFAFTVDTMANIIQ